MDKIKEMAERLEQRMYGLVPYNISPIQQGIQFGHAVQEYNNIARKSDMHVKPGDSNYHGFYDWADNDKTFIILNGGTTNNNEESLGTLNYAESELYSLGIQIATFHEPDLGDQLTAIVFLVDEHIYDYAKYPTYDFMRDEVSEFEYYETLFGKEYEHILDMRGFLSKYKLA